MSMSSVSPNDSNIKLDEFKACVARRLQMDPETLYQKSITLAEVVVRSPVASNSIDLMEAVAGAMAELEIDDRIELPAITLQHTVDELVAEVRTQLVAQGIS